MALTPLPIAPNTLRPDTFSAEMDAFLAALPTFQEELNAAGAAAGLATIAASTTSLTIGTGSKSLTANTGCAFTAGMEVFIASTASSSNRMVGLVTSYDSGTGALVVNVTSTTGSGTFAAWSIGPSTTVNFDGQTYTNLILNGKITEQVYALSGTVIDPANGSIQTKTLAANTTFTESLADGNSVVLLITASTYTVTWPTMTWAWGSAPTLPTSGKAAIVLFQVAGTLYGIYAGSLA